MNTGGDGIEQKCLMDEVKLDCQIGEGVEAHHTGHRHPEKGHPRSRHRAFAPFS